MLNKSITGMLAILIASLIIQHNAAGHAPVKPLPPQVKQMEWRVKAFPVKGEKLLDIVKVKTPAHTISFIDQTTVNLTALEDWLRGAVISLANTSHMTINAIKIELRVRPTDSHKYTALTDIGIGSYSHLPGIQPTIWIRPGEIAEIALPDARFERVADAIRSASTSGASKVTLDIEIIQIVFEELKDTIWRRDSWYRRDPANPYGFYRVNSISDPIDTPAIPRLVGTVTDNNDMFRKKPRMKLLARNVFNSNAAFISSPPKKNFEDQCLLPWYIDFTWCLETLECHCFLDDEYLAYMAGSYDFNLEWESCICGQTGGSLCLQWDYKLAPMYNSTCTPPE